MAVRRPAVAGQFYPGRADVLAADVDRLFERAAAASRTSSRAAVSSDRTPAIGLLVPHAGYTYSGAIAAEVYARAGLPGRALLLGPNHTGLGARAALFPAPGAWDTPLGRVEVDDALTAALLEQPLVTPDPEAHLLEHSIEVQLPLLQRRLGRFALAALCLAHLRYEECEALGRAVARAVRARGPAVVVASSDMSHYLPAEVARERDRLALDAVLALDARALHETVRREDLSMCGFIPATVMLAAARELGASRAELVRYGHSGEASGDHASVVGYAGVIVS